LVRNSLGVHTFPLHFKNKIDNVNYPTIITYPVAYTKIKNITGDVRIVSPKVYSENKIISSTNDSLDVDEKLHDGKTFYGKQVYNETVTPGLAAALIQCNELVSSKNWTNYETLLYRLEVLRKFIPPAKQFLSDFKNPCWYDSYTFPTNMKYMHFRERRHVPLSNDLALLKQVFPENNNTVNKPKNKLKCLPYFHLVGFPKCGTTALFQYINSHPEYVASCAKEPQWWGNYKIYDEKERDIASVLYYIKCFDEAAEKIKEDRKSFITGDSSTTTVWRQPTFFHHMEKRLPCEIPLLIDALQPKAKFIILMREPIEQFYSAFWDFCREKKDPAAFHQMVEHDLKSWKNCMQIHSTTHCLYINDTKQNDTVCGINGLVHNIYYVFVSIWLQVIPRNRILFLKTEDLKERPIDVLKDVYNFLELSPVSDVQLSKIISRKHINEQSFLHTDERLHMMSSTRNLLAQFYKPFNQKLAQLLGDDRFLWKDVYY